MLTLVPARIRTTAPFQDRGALVTQEDRCIAFPNSMQHRVAPFRLIGEAPGPASTVKSRSTACARADNTKPGIRKILVFFLVDPNAVDVPTTADVPPQQRAWFERELYNVESLRGPDVRRSVVAAVLTV